MAGFWRQAAVKTTTKSMPRLTSGRTRRGASRRTRGNSCPPGRPHVTHGFAASESMTNSTTAGPDAATVSSSPGRSISLSRRGVTASRLPGCRHRRTPARPACRCRRCPHPYGTARVVRADSSRRPSRARTDPSPRARSGQRSSGRLPQCPPERAPNRLSKNRSAALLSPAISSWSTAVPVTFSSSTCSSMNHWSMTCVG
jgi:hypothetical protein